MKQIGITTGCSETTYCPDTPVTRAQMAVFIMRGLFNLLMPSGTPLLSIAPVDWVAGTDPDGRDSGAGLEFRQWGDAGLGGAHYEARQQCDCGECHDADGAVAGGRGGGDGATLDRCYYGQSGGHATEWVSGDVKRHWTFQPSTRI